MVIQVTGNYNLLPDPSWRAVQLMEVYLECDTSVAPVTINLFPIYSLEYFWNVKIYVTDKSNNASTNSITINTGVSDTIDGNKSLVIGENGGGVELAVLNNSSWLAIETTETTNTYKFATLPTRSIVSSAPNNSQLYGQLYDNSLVFPPANYVIELDGGVLCAMFYPQTILSDGTLIYEAYEINPTTLIYGYWVAMRPQANDPTQLEKIAQCQMTSQFWNNYYDYTYQSATNPKEVIFVTPNYPTSDSTPLNSFNTKLTLVGNVLSATDSIVGPGTDVLTLYNNLTGEGIGTGVWTYSSPIYSMEDDYARMMDGTKAGWIFYGEDGVGNFQWQVGWNILTGETMVVTPINSLQLSSNFNPSASIDETFFNPLWTSHPKGVLYLVYNQQGVDNGANTNSVSALWSPQWINNLRVQFLPIRDLYSGGFINTNALLFNATLSPVYTYGFDGESIYQVIGTYSSATYGSQAFKMSQIKLDATTDLIMESVLPALVDTSIGLVTIWENKNGIISFWVQSPALETFATFEYYHWKKDKKKPILLQSNNSYPTNILGSKIYSTSSQLNRNATALTIEYDIYNLNF